MQSNGFSYEIIFIDDGSTDGSWQVIDLAQQNPAVKGIRFSKLRKITGFACGFLKAHEVVITMDADLQDSPDEIPQLYQMILQGNDLVSGWKKRYDHTLPRIFSKLFNLAARKVSGLQLHDFNCTSKPTKTSGQKHRSYWRDASLHSFVSENAGFRNIVENRSNTVGNAALPNLVLADLTMDF